ncbi:MAG TPA: S53 family peptidase [Streptosporangiaceae bacterium]|nr:S53 family peptidase [Streptosporangiaceae bacterium]
MKSARWAVAAAIAAVTAAGTALAAVPAQAASVRSLTGSRPAWATAKALSGKTAGSSHMGFRVYLGWRSDPTSLIRAVTTPGSSQYRHFVTAAQFRSEFAPTSASVQAVQQWLTSAGFSVDYTPANHLYVAADGTVAKVNAAFHTTIGTYAVHGKSLRAPETTPSVPSSLPQFTVVGLDDSAALVHTDHIVADASPSPGFRNAPQCSSYWGQKTTANTPEPTPLVTSSGTISSPSSVTVPNYPNGSATSTMFSPCGYTPSQLRGAYGLSDSDTGAGQTVAIIDAYASPTIVADANEYFSRHNVPASGGTLIPPLSGSNFTQIVAPGTYRVPENPKQDPQGWYGEETLDIEAVHAMAPAAHIVFVGAPNNYQDLDAALNKVVDGHLASMVTNSYGWSTEALPPGYIKPYLDIMQQAAATGIGVYFSSGDNGDETGGVAGATPTPDWPASSPLVTAVGGTALAVGSGNTRTGEWGWETSKATLSGTDPSALTWNPASYLYGSGGGVSRLFAQPSYQAGVVPSAMSQYYGGTPMRVVPDVSAVGDVTTGMLVGQTQAFPDGNSYDEYRIGGTSLASPLFTGMMADVQARAGSDIGFANPMLYRKAAAFSDIGAASPGMAQIRSDYVNGVDGSDGYVVSARTIGDDGALTIHAGKGYDDVTGLGSPNGTSWLAALAGH